MRRGFFQDIFKLDFVLKKGRVVGKESCKVMDGKDSDSRGMGGLDC